MNYNQGSLDAIFTADETNSDFFSFSDFDIQLQQQAQISIPSFPQKQIHNVDRYLPVSCPPFTITSQPPPPPLPYQSSPEPKAELLDFAPVVLSQWSSPPAPDSLVHTHPSPDALDPVSGSPKHHPLTPPGTNLPSLSPQPTIQTSVSPSASSPPSNASPNALLDTSPYIPPVIDFNKLMPPSLHMPEAGEGPKQKKTAHNAIERRYRNNINDRITELKNVVPALLHAKLKNNQGGSKRSRAEDDDDDGEDDEEFLDGVAVATKLNKATILRKATEYITHLKRSNDDLRAENDTLQQIMTQLPGGPTILAQYKQQKVQREQMMQQQLMMERQRAKHEQQVRKRANASSRRKRSRQPSQTYPPLHQQPQPWTSAPPQLYQEDWSSAKIPAFPAQQPPTPPSTGVIGQRVFMAVFMAVSLFSSSPLTSSANVDNQHNHVSRATAENANTILSSSTVLTTSTLSSLTFGYVDDVWVFLRYAFFFGYVCYLVLPWIKTLVLGKSFKMRRVQRRRYPVAKRSLRGRQTEQQRITPGDATCMQLHQLLVDQLTVEHQDGSARDAHQHRLALVICLAKQVGQWLIRHGLGYDICLDDHELPIGQDLDDSDDDGASFLSDDATRGSRRREQRRWQHVLRWIKLNECECLGGDRTATKWTMVYHSLRMLNLVDALEEDFCRDMRLDGPQAERQRQLSSMRARAYATATMQWTVLFSPNFLVQKITQYLWKTATWDANEDDIWASLTEDDHPSVMALFTNAAWTETLMAIHLQLTSSAAQPPATPPTRPSVALSAHAPTLVPTTILANLTLMDRLEMDFTAMIDGLMLAQPVTFFAYVHALPLEDDARRLADWFTMIGATIECLWQHQPSERSMAALVHNVPRAMLVPTASYKQKLRFSDVDAWFKQHLVHLLAGTTLIHQGQLEPLTDKPHHALASGLDQLKQARQLWTMMQQSIPSQYNKHLEAQFMEGRLMALATLGACLVALDAWLSVPASYLHDEDHEEIRALTLCLRRMVNRPALAGLSCQSVLVDRLSRVGRAVANGSSDLDHDDDDGASDNNLTLVEDHPSPLENHVKILGILHGAV
ncbi:hypothetical protein DM01DRAFT_1332593 [Hesseltinella vesiculosa]|uniref:BHLH domain-containing protein n=1 Tax=Hesseltinella vesiculosa TaxID=101127 RepID=A0A1X2GSG9_9FUNG|nr:hypothetical protein DM01DRAFT_1332593 [Hesseltinella vesiculosa]